jgi:putative ABC transport system ATP-binding protein
MVGLSGLGPAMPQELSGGETQRVAFARAIAHEPPILLADEPTASLDSENSRQLIRLMRHLAAEQGCTLIAATHDPDMIENTEDKLFLKDGAKAGFYSHEHRN